MSFHLRYGEPDWNESPCQGGHGQEIRQHPLSDKSYEELRYQATQKQWATKFVDLNTMALSSATPTATFVNLKNLTDTVEVIVGEGDDQARWVLHSSLLTNDSEFASMALSRDFKEKSERIIRFPEEDPGVFGQYVTFLYAKMVFVFALETLVQMYTLGDRLQSIKFANACYESIAKTTDPYSASQIKYIFDNTCTDDRLRKLCISQVGKGILDGRYSFSIPHEQAILKDSMPELMVGVTAEVQKRRSGGDKWYPRPQSSETGSGFSVDRPLFGPAPARSVNGGPFTMVASGSGAGIFGGPSPAANGGGLFGTGSSPPSSTTTGGGLFGAQRSNNIFTGGLFGGSNSNSGTATSNNPFGAASSSTSAAGTAGGLFNNHQHPPQPASSLFGGDRRMSLFSNHQNQPQSTSSLFGHTSRNQQQPPSGGLFGGPIQSHQDFANGGSDTGNVQSIRPQGIVHGFGQSRANATQSGSTTDTISPAPAHTASTTQSSSIAPSLFNTSTASPFAAAPAPHGPPVFSFLPTSPTQTQYEQQNPTPSFSFALSASTSAPDAPQSAPKMWTVRNDSSQTPCLSGTSSPQNGTVANTNGNNGEQDQPTGDAASLAALEKGSTINNPTRGFVPYTTSNFAPSNGLKFGTSPFHQIISGKSHAEGTSPFGQRVKGWRPAENGKPSRFVSSQDASDSHENGNEEGKGKGKEPALDDAALSRDLMDMAFPGSQSVTQSDDAYLKNAQGGKITKDDKLDPDFGEYLRRASQGKAKDNGNEAQEMGSESKDQITGEQPPTSIPPYRRRLPWPVGWFPPSSLEPRTPSQNGAKSNQDHYSEHQASEGEPGKERSVDTIRKASTSTSEAITSTENKPQKSESIDGVDDIDYDAIEADMAAGEAEEARLEGEHAKRKAAEREALRKHEED